jgi:hypothetical protein
LLINFFHHRHFSTLAPRQPTIVVTPHNYSYRARCIAKSGDKLLEFCEIAVTSVFKASKGENCRCADPWGHPSTIFFF